MRVLSLLVLVPALLVGRVAIDSDLKPSTGPITYIALGDSLAASMQPDSNGHDRATTDGYVETVYRSRSGIMPGLQLLKLGRGGETSASMINSSQPGPTQLELAEQALRRGAAALVTIDIGANEVETCAQGSRFDQACVKRGLASIRESLPRIVKRLRAAGGLDLRIVGINYYNSFLGRWVTGAQGRRLALASVPVERSINATLAQVYGQLNVPVADVEDAFQTDQFKRWSSGSAGHGRVPLAVALTCRWTWACSARYDDHTNSAGYRVIARTVLALLDAESRSAPLRAK